MTELPKMLMILGGVLLLIGLLWQVVGKIPGDIVVKKGNFTFFFPIVTSIIISVVLSLVFYFIGRFR
ncbi:DUF2905 domain-containing protein [Sutcliffiella cohnii]|uniref:DUF2905 domain-containing protein n=1 Tax=Sutcliffiella cohnii TaxID=33932 RepID=A0A223KT86_9BACI|nr:MULTISPECIES: DUF2905 domain-containing protein [Sutcliffiella]AST92712.1 hypothetical protein BC6307_16160 [Sutcliffiella cohnii]MED4016386.1 DUF2905 domain-containing protein [Sutcliffiella cohnii]WBL13961.1 DUF2905 domain-containing protein [Sutcliffiella sp. NC1]